MFMKTIGRIAINQNMNREYIMKGLGSFSGIAIMTLGFAAVFFLPVFAEDAPDIVMEPIHIELPEPAFGGKPLDYWSPNLEPQDYRDRPPFLAPKGTSNVALNKTVTSSVPPVHGELKQITDGDKSYQRSSVVEIPGGVQWVQVDLGKEHTIFAVLVWHFHGDIPVYFDMVMQVSSDPEFKKGVTTLFNNDCNNSSGLGIGEDKEYVESYRGRLVDTKGISGRYVRLYGNGNNENAFTHFEEIEVYGIPKNSNDKDDEGEDLVPVHIELPEPGFG